jgi:hypothetical protein
MTYGRFRTHFGQCSFSRDTDIDSVAAEQELSLLKLKQLEHSVMPLARVIAAMQAEISELKQQSQRDGTAMAAMQAVLSAMQIDLSELKQQQFMVPFMQFGTVQDRGLTPAQAAVVMDPARTHVLPAISVNGLIDVLLYQGHTTSEGFFIWQKNWVSIARHRQNRSRNYRQDNLVGVWNPSRTVSLRLSVRNS